jgi:hypothetical protein
MIDCCHWEAIEGRERHGRCKIGRYGGRPSFGTCMRCGDRNEIDAEPIDVPPEPEPPRMAPVVALRAARNTAVCQGCQHFNGVNANGTIRCAQCGCENLPPWAMDKCPEGKWRASVELLQPQNLKFKSPGGIVPLTDMYRGASCFLLCGGPSLRRSRVWGLQSRQLLTMTMNNAAHMFLPDTPPDLWCCVDQPFNADGGYRFLESIWRDPRIMKFAPVQHYHRIGQHPNVWGYTHVQPFRWWRFLAEQRVRWGSNVMMICIRILYELGVRRIYLLGADFHMEADEPYAFEESVGPEHVRSNNRSYAMLNHRFMLLRPLLEQHGMRVVNCTEGGELTAFERMGYDQAVDEALDGFPLGESTRGRYCGMKHLAAMGPDTTTRPAEGPPGRPAQRDDHLDAAGAGLDDRHGGPG